jgi:transcriptional regulator with XRE-family HTH domain
MSNRRNHGNPEANLPTLLTDAGFTLSAAERASGLFRGTLSRLLAGRRGKGVRLETVRQLSRGTGIPLEVVAEALEISLAQAEERRRCIAEVERACLAAELR